MIQSTRPYLIILEVKLKISNYLSSFYRVSDIILFIDSYAIFYYHFELWILGKVVWYVISIILES